MRILFLSTFMLLAAFSQTLTAQTAPEEAVVIFDVRMDLIAKSEVGKKLLGMAAMGQTGEDEPDPSKMDRLFGAMTLPGSVQEAMGLQMGQFPMELFARMKFDDTAEAEKFLNMAKEDNSGTIEKNGKTYYKTPDEGGPMMLLHAIDANTIEVGTEEFVTDDPSVMPFSDGLKSAWSNVPKDQSLRLVLDLDGAKDLINEAVEMGKQQGGDPMTQAYLELVDNIKDLRISLDLVGDNLLTIQAAGVDAEQAEEFKEGLDALLGTAKLAGGAGLIQLKDANPDAAAVGKSILDSLNAKLDGTEVSVVVPKPAKFDEVVSKLIDQVPMMMGGMGPGF
ncbi:MAG: hypothetical protein AAF939_14195 [Planctomycetota bacterium]